MAPEPRFRSAREGLLRCPLLPLITRGRMCAVGAVHGPERRVPRVRFASAGFGVLAHHDCLR